VAEVGAAVTVEAVAGVEAGLAVEAAASEALAEEVPAAVAPAEVGDARRAATGGGP
jgi:hypothetical protein